MTNVSRQTVGFKLVAMFYLHCLVLEQCSCLNPHCKRQTGAFFFN